jgi:hypothetical protein
MKWFVYWRHERLRRECSEFEEKIATATDNLRKGLVCVTIGKDTIRDLRAQRDRIEAKRKALSAQLWG